MNASITEEIMTLKDQSLETLKTRYSELFPGEPPPSNNKVFLWRKIAYRLQEIEYGGLPEDTTNRINELIERYDPINNKTMRPKKTTGHNVAKSRDVRLPIPGAVIRKEYKGQILEVKVLDNGFEFKETTYKTLSAIAQVVTGAHWNGYHFFKP